MSSLDRAFFRAYAKEQPSSAAEPPSAAPPEVASPYVYFQSQRRPQLRYRIEPTHAPWGGAAADETVGLEAASPGTSELPAAEEAMATPAWGIDGTAHLAEPSEPRPPQPDSPKVPMGHAPAAERPSDPYTAMNPFAAGIVCLPGLETPESNYLATLVPVDTPEEVTAPLTTAPIVEPEPIAAATSQSDEPAECREPVSKTNSGTASDAVEGDPAAEVPAAVDAGLGMLAGEAASFWEVDRYLYPAISDRLLSRYEYFAHAGTKLKQASEAGLKVLGITGVGRDEGRSTLAICLARAAARSGLKVALIDCDFQRPQLAQHIGLDVAAGWESVALRGAALAEVSIRSLEDGVLLLPLLNESQSSALSLSGEPAINILSQLKQTHDVIILDAGPFDSQSSDTPAADHAGMPLDAAIVVWDRRRRKLDEAETVARQLTAAGVQAVGIAENFAS